MHEHKCPRCRRYFDCENKECEEYSNCLCPGCWLKLEMVA